jgi:hypothetical protein
LAAGPRSRRSQNLAAGRRPHAAIREGPGEAPHPLESNASQGAGPVTTTCSRRYRRPAIPPVAPTCSYVCSGASARARDGRHPGVGPSRRWPTTRSIPAARRTPASHMFKLRGSRVRGPTQPGRLRLLEGRLRRRTSPAAPSPRHRVSGVRNRSRGDIVPIVERSAEEEASEEGAAGDAAPTQRRSSGTVTTLARRGTSRVSPFAWRASPGPLRRCPPTQISARGR